MKWQKINRLSNFLFLNRAINFATYGNGKKFFTEMNGGKETSLVHLSSAATAGTEAAK